MCDSHDMFIHRSTQQKRQQFGEHLHYARVLVECGGERQRIFLFMHIFLCLIVPVPFLASFIQDPSIGEGGLSRLL